jgi:hypothetical protein
VHYLACFWYGVGAATADRRDESAVSWATVYFLGHGDGAASAAPDCDERANGADCESGWVAGERQGCVCVYVCRASELPGGSGRERDGRSFLAAPMWCGGGLRPDAPRDVRRR